MGARLHALKALFQPQRFYDPFSCQPYKVPLQLVVHRAHTDIQISQFCCSYEKLLPRSRRGPGPPCLPAHLESRGAPVQARPPPRPPHARPQHLHGARPPPLAVLGPRLAGSQLRVVPARSARPATAAGRHLPIAPRAPPRAAPIGCLREAGRRSLGAPRRSQSEAGSGATPRSHWPAVAVPVSRGRQGQLPPRRAGPGPGPGPAEREPCGAVATPAEPPLPPSS